MNFNEEIAKELNELGCNGEIIPIKEEDKGTPEDYLKLEKKMIEIDERNTDMLRKSQRNAQFCPPCAKYTETQLTPLENQTVVNTDQSISDKFMGRFMSKLEKDQFERRVEPIVGEEFILTDKVISDELYNYGKLLESPIFEEATKEDSGYSFVKKK